jgi:hypothetical protein
MPGVRVKNQPKFNQEFGQVRTFFRGGGGHPAIIKMSTDNHGGVMPQNEYLAFFL